MNIKDYYSVLELDDSTIYSVIRLKKQFYKLSSRYHPDRFINNMYPDSIKEKYTSIVIAYNYLKSNCFKLLKNEDLATSTPKDHTALKFINKIDIYDVDIDNKNVDNSKFNEDFLKNISEEDNSNLKLFLELGLSEQDIDNQFSLLHPEPKTIKENGLYQESTLKLEKIFNQRQEEIVNYLPSNIINAKT
jgi:curved DNA-binding protein CbpA